MHPVKRWLSLVAALALFGFVLELGIASASVPSPEPRMVAEPYRAGPLERRAAASTIEWPRGSEELLALGVLAAILYGFRASGLAGRPGPKGQEVVKGVANPKRDPCG